MRRAVAVRVLVCCTVFLAIPPLEAGGEIHGTIRTRDGRVLTGPIRWDRNEAYWDDVLDAARRPDPPPVKKNEAKGFELSLFGLKLFDHGQDGNHRALAVPFGHLRAIEIDPANDDTWLVLKDGSRIQAIGTSTDLGPSLREVLIDDAQKGAVKLGWFEIARVEFAPSPLRAGRDSLRLHASVETARTTLVGYLTWNRNQVLASDTVEIHQGDQLRHVRFDELSEIQVVGRVRLKSGVEGRLAEEPGDVILAVPGLGHIGVNWREVRRLTFSAPPPSRAYAAFDGGKPLEGTAYPREGPPQAGTIVWDRDERTTWETLDGNDESLEVEVRFENVRVIKRLSLAESEVTLRDDRKLRLAGTNDVDDSNRGVVVNRPDGTVVEFRWAELDRIEFR